MSKPQEYGVLAEFGSPADLIKAAETLRDQGFKQFDTYSPFPIHGMDRAMGLGGSKLGWIVLGGGACGASLGFGLQTWVATTAYPLTISGKPFFSFQAFVPVTFELMVLFSAFSAVFGMLALNKLPEFYHAVFNGSRFEKVSSDGFFLSVEASDKQYDRDRLKKELGHLGAKSIEWIEA